MGTEDPGLEPLNALMLDLRQEAFKYLGQGSRVAEMVIAMLDASATHLPAASEEPANPDPLHLSRILHEMAGAVSLCWEPWPSGVFESSMACGYVAAAIAEIRSRMTATAQPAPTSRLKWMEAPRRTEWGAGMMEALIALGADETLLLYAHRDAVPLVDALLSAQSLSGEGLTWS